MAPGLGVASIIALALYSYRGRHGPHETCVYYDLCGIVVLVTIITVVALVVVVTFVTIITLCEHFVWIA